MKFIYEFLIYLKQLNTLRFAKIISAAQALPPHSSHKEDPPNEEGTCQFQLYMNLIQYGGLGMTKGKRKKILFFLYLFQTAIIEKKKKVSCQHDS